MPPHGRRSRAGDLQSAFQRRGADGPGIGHDPAAASYFPQTVRGVLPRGDEGADAGIRADRVIPEEAIMRRTIILPVLLLLALGSTSGVEAMEQRDASGKRWETAVLGGGCFWCLEAVYEDMDGVREVVSGYAGGDEPRPTYQEVCSGGTGHAEVVQVTFDPSVVTYRELLDVFFRIHDPTTPNRQGADVGPQYRSIILTDGDAQRRIAEAAVREENAADHWDDELVTEIVPLQTFHRAEEYHQDYFRRNPGQGYCQAVVAPKLRKFRETFPDKRR